MEQVRQPANIILNNPKTKLCCFQTIDSRKTLDSRFRGNDKEDAGIHPFCHPRLRTGIQVF